MPLCNKVDPSGAIVAETMRGLFMGNRGGQMHDPVTRTLRPGRPWVSRQWITCLTEFKGRKRTLMGPGSYTELFFLDEVVSLAAGHRPCAECRRKDYKSFCAHAKATGIKAADLDQLLHNDRTGKRQTVAEAGELPDGAMISVGGLAHAKRAGLALRFGFAGYEARLPWDLVAVPDAQVLTPATMIAALRNGYEPVWHSSAGLDAAD